MCFIKSEKYLKFIIICCILYLNILAVSAEQSKRKILILVGTYVNSCDNCPENVDAVTSATRSIHGSYTGSTFEIANIIKGRFIELGCNVDLLKAENKNIDLEGYDLIIIGSSIQGGVPNSNIKDFVNSNYEILKQKKVAAFAVCASILSEDEKKKNLAESFSDSVACGLNTLSKTVFAGHVPDLGWLQTKMMKLFLGIKNFKSGSYLNQKEIETWVTLLFEKLNY